VATIVTTSLTGPPPLLLVDDVPVTVVSGHGVVGVGKVNSCGAHLVELPARPWRGVGKVDEVHDLWAAEAGDLHSAHSPEVRA
jgi:hypothetical protein